MKTKTSTSHNPCMHKRIHKIYWRNSGKFLCMQKLKFHLQFLIKYNYTTYTHYIHFCLFCKLNYLYSNWKLIISCFNWLVVARESNGNFVNVDRNGGSLTFLSRLVPAFAANLSVLMLLRRNGRKSGIFCLSRLVTKSPNWHKNVEKAYI